MQWEPESSPWAIIPKYLKRLAASHDWGLNGDLTIPLNVVVQRDLQLKGKRMYSRQNIQDLIKMVEIGLLKLGGQKVDKFALED